MNLINISTFKLSNRTYLNCYCCHNTTLFCPSAYVAQLKMLWLTCPSPWVGRHSLSSKTLFTGLKIRTGRHAQTICAQPSGVKHKRAGDATMTRTLSREVAAALEFFHKRATARHQLVARVLTLKRVAKVRFSAI